MGIYSSKMSCWERQRAKLAQDHAGPEVIGETPGLAPVEPEAKVEAKPQPKAEDSAEGKLEASNEELEVGKPKRPTKKVKTTEV